MTRLNPAVVIASLTAIACIFDSAHASELSLPVPKVTIYPGEVIADHALTLLLLPAPVDAAVTYHVTRQGLVGRVPKRTLLPGRPVPLNATREPDLVIQGRTYPLLFEADGLRIATIGVPLQSGGLGDAISVRNAESGAVVRGIVRADRSLLVVSP